MEDADCVDDAGIADTENLWRYIDKVVITRDRTTGALRPMTDALIDARMSVDVASQTTLADAQRRNPNRWPLQFSVGVVRQMGKCVTQQIDIDPANPAHAIVCPQLTKTQARILASGSNWVVAPPDDLVP